MRIDFRNDWRRPDDYGGWQFMLAHFGVARGSVFSDYRWTVLLVVFGIGVWIRWEHPSRAEAWNEAIRKALGGEFAANIVPPEE